MQQVCIDPNQPYTRRRLSVDLVFELQLNPLHSADGSPFRDQQDRRSTATLLVRIRKYTMLTCLTGKLGVATVP